MPIPSAKDNYFPLNQKDIKLVCGIKMLLDAIPNNILAANMRPKLSI
jgi:hypothetical protein